MISPESLIGEEEINEAFENTNFGSRTPREVVADSVLKAAAGFHTGHTAEQICRKLRLFDSDQNLTEFGKKYFRACFWDVCTKFSPTEKEAFNAAREEIFQDRFGKWKYPTFEDYLNDKNNK